MRITLALLVVLISQVAKATTLPQLTVAELYSKADVVAVVEIKSGAIIESGEYVCGANYKGKVVTPLKGDFKEGQIIGFGPFGGHKIGHQYLAFLTTKKNSYNPMTSTNSIQMNAEAKRNEVCGPLYEGYEIMFSGFGALEISWTTKFDYKDAVKLKDEWLKAPEGLLKKPVELGDNEMQSHSGEFWIKIEDMVGYINELQRK